MTAGLSLDFGVQIRAGLDHVAAQNQKLARAIETARAREPFDARIVTSGSSPSSGDFGLSVSGPDVGYYWHVRRIVIGGANFSSTVAGTGEIYVTALTTNSGSITGEVLVRDLNDLVDEYTALPKVAFYSEHQLVLQPNENLVAVVHSPTASTLYKMSAQVQVFRTITTGEGFNA